MNRIFIVQVFSAKIYAERVDLGKKIAYLKKIQEATIL
jgi:hypothetical protein